jgi:hypothetical protein
MATEANEAPPEPQGQRRGPPTSWTKTWTGFIAQTGALVGVVAGVLSLVFIAKPGCQPQAPVDFAAGSISDVRIERGVSFGQYLDRLELSHGTISDAFLNRPGVLIQFHYAIKGFKGKMLPLSTQLIDEDSHDRVGEVERGVAIHPVTNEEERDWYAWISVPEMKRKYHAVVTIYAPDGRVPLRAFPTEPFDGLGASP